MIYNEDEGLIVLRYKEEMGSVPAINYLRAQVVVQHDGTTVTKILKNRYGRQLNSLPHEKLCSLMSMISVDSPPHNEEVRYDGVLSSLGANRATLWAADLLPTVDVALENVR